MPNYTFRCTYCKEEQDIVVSKVFKIGERYFEKCCNCEHNELERVYSNKVNIGFKGLTTPGKG